MKKKSPNIIKRSLTLQLSLLVAISSAIVLALFGWYRYEKQASEMEAQLYKSLQVTSRTLKTILFQPLFNYDMKTIEMVCKATMEKPEIVFITIYEKDNLSIMSLEKDEKNIIRHVDEVKHRPGLLYQNDDITFKNHVIASLHLGATTKYLNESLISTMKTIVLQIVALEVLLVFALFIILRRKFIYPLQDLTKITSLIADGDLDHDVVSYGNNEIGLLAKSFFFMRDSIRNTISELNREVQERKHAENELKNLRNYLTNIIDSMPSVLVGVDAYGKVTQWNKTAERATGISATKAHGRSLDDVFPVMMSEMNKIKESIKTRKIIHDQKKVRLSDTGSFFEDITIFPLIANGVEGAVIRIDDVSEKVQMEEMMVQNEKMLSVGGLAAGMAHEINNPLAGMMQTAEVMTTRLGSEPDMPANLKAAENAGISMSAIKEFMEARGILRMLKTINESGRRVADIVDNMLSFARKSDAQISSQDILELIDKTLELAATDFDLKKNYDFKQIVINKAYQKNLPKIPCEVGKIQQVLLNILRNGSQAMQEEPNSEKIPTLNLNVYHNNKDNKICIEIEDNGPGMSEDIRKRVFEPFFTTKPVGIGTGLGLSVSYFIITENHGGEMLVESQPGKSTTFIIRLPINGVSAINAGQVIV